LEVGSGKLEVLLVHISITFHKLPASIFHLQAINQKSKKHAVNLITKNADVSYRTFPELLSADSFLGKSSAFFTAGTGASSV